MKCYKQNQIKQELNPAQKGIGIFMQATPENCMGQSPSLFTLPAVMTIETIESLAAELKQFPLPENTLFTLDATQVQTITTPGLQLICSLEKTLSAQGGTLTITGQRDAFTHAFKDAGLESLLGKTA